MNCVSDMCGDLRQSRLTEPLNRVLGTLTFPLYLLLLEMAHRWPGWKNLLIPFENECPSCKSKVANSVSVHRQARYHICYLHDIEHHLRVASVYEHLVAYVRCSFLLGQ